MRKLSKKRIEMGEEAWSAHQQKRNYAKYKTYSVTERGQQNAFAVKETRRKIKRLLIEYKGGKCERCPYDKACPAAYDFHHKDPNEKEFALSKCNLSLERQKREVDKCMLLCANCHRELHYEEDLLIIEEEKKKLLFSYGAIKAT